MKKVSKGSLVLVVLVLLIWVGTGYAAKLAPGPSKDPITGKT